MMVNTEGLEVLFNSIRVFERVPEGANRPDMRLLVSRGYRVVNDPNDYLWVGAGNSDEESDRQYPVDIEDTVYDSKSDTYTFSAYGNNYTIRALQPDDGKWLSRLKISLPTKALEYMTSEKEEDSVNRDAEEQLIAYSVSDNSGPIFAVQYINGFGSFVRISGKWMLLSPDDESFDDMYVYDIDPDKSPEFMSEFDKGDMTVEQVQDYMLMEEESQ